jgi:LmbE family N-acetylglucosaminyl deacetylase
VSGSVLLAPHHDDESLFASFLILRYRPLVVTVLGRAERQAQHGYPGGPIPGSIREQETAEAMRLLDARWVSWEFSDLNPDWPAISRAIAELAGSFDRCFAPAVEDEGHGQHNHVGALALAHFGRDRVTAYTTYRNGYGRSGGEQVPFDPDWPVLKLRALACYESQIRCPSTGHHFLAGLREYVA